MSERTQIHAFIHTYNHIYINIISIRIRSDHQYNPRGSMAAVKKKITIVHNLRMLKIKSKDYGKGKFLHNFMLEEVINVMCLYICVYVSIFIIVYIYVHKFKNVKN
jgi:ABC-type lipoprotein release transport system permease subunit